MSRLYHLVILFIEAMQPLVSNVHKIAVLRANALGDLIMTLPALDALKAAYPQAEIVLLAGPWHAEFLAGRPSPVSRVVVIPPLHHIDQPTLTPELQAELDAFFRRMQAERFDIAVQLHGGGKQSNPFVLGLGARLTVGLKTPDAAPLDRWIPYLYYQREILRYLEVVSLVGARPTRLDPHLAVTARDLRESRHVVPETERRLVVLHPGASDPRRRWPAESFAQLGDRLAETGTQVVVTGVEHEADVCAAVVEGMRAEAVNACGRLSLSGLTGLLARAAVVVSNDTGPRHLAEAVGTPTVGIYWCGNVINAGPATAARHRTALSWRLNCPVCGFDCTLGRCPHDDSFVADVTVDEVTELALGLFAHALNSFDQATSAPISVGASRMRVPPLPAGEGVRFSTRSATKSGGRDGRRRAGRRRAAAG